MSRRVVLVDDHGLFLAGVKAELGDAVEVVGEAGTVTAAIPLIESLDGAIAATTDHNRRREPEIGIPIPPLQRAHAHGVAFSDQTIRQQTRPTQPCGFRH